MIDWFNDKGYEADITALRKLRPESKTFKTWLLKNGWTGEWDSKRPRDVTKSLLRT